jgi:hypothetical protein
MANQDPSAKRERRPLRESSVLLSLDLTVKGCYGRIV